MDIPQPLSQSDLDAARSRKLLRKAASQLVDLEYQTWYFGDSTAFEAMVDASSALEEHDTLEFARGYMRAWATRAAPYRLMDLTAPGQAMIRVHQLTGDGQILAAAVDLAAFLVDRARLNDVLVTFERSPLEQPFGGAALSLREAALQNGRPKGVFIDCLHFDAPFFAALGAVLGERRWFDHATEQVLGYIRLLQQQDGLFDHFILDGSPMTYGQGWGRGQGWALLGLLGVLGELPAAHPHHDVIASSATRLIARMVGLQRPDGHWYAVVDDPMSGDETSTAAFMATAFYRAVRLGVASDELIDAAQRALRAAVAKADEAALLRGASAAVGVSTHPSHYRHVPTDHIVPWGQGPFVLALAEHLMHQSRHGRREGTQG